MSRFVRNTRELAVLLSGMLLIGGCGVRRDDNTANAVSDAQVEAQNDAQDEQVNAPQLRLMQFALIFLQARYVEPSRIEWRKMTVYAVDALQNMVPEVVARFDRRIDDSPMALDLHVGDKSRKFALDEIQSLTQAYQVSQSVFDFVYGNMSGHKDAADMEYAMINGMFSTLDPHTNLLPPYMFEDVMTGNGGFAGCGFVVGVRDDNLTVIAPMEGTPAWRVGIKSGDIIVRIDDESTENMPLQDAVDRMRGDAGSKVTLYIKRRGWTEARPFVITREKIQVKSVTSQALKKDKVGYLKLKSFDQTTGFEVRTHLDKLHAEMPDMKGLIIDLRNNSGGLLEQSIIIAEYFLAKGETIVSVEGPSKADRASEHARKDGSERGYPIVVLINEGTASASEIVSGALQYNNRAVIVGERSFGKGSVQILKDNADGSAIKITSAQYLTPGDISIQGVGIVPDIRLIPSYVDADSGISLVETQNVRREDTLEKSLHSNKTTQRESAQSLRYLYQPPKEDEERAKALGITTYDLHSTEDYTEDSETRFAVDLIKQAGSAQRNEILEQSSAFFENYAKNYRDKLKKAMAGLKIDWNAGDNTCRSYSWGLKFDDQNAGNGGHLDFAADGVEKQLKLWVKNDCPSGDITQLSAALTSNNGAFDEREFVFGRIKPGATSEWPVKVKLPKSMPSRDDNVEIRFYQGEAASLQNEPTERGSFVASVVRPSQPRFAYTYWIDDVQRGNHDGALSRGESVDYYLWITNIGDVDSEKIRINIANESGSGVLLQQGRASIDKLAVGQSQLVVLKFDVSQDRPQKPPSKRIKRDRPFNPDEALLRMTISDEAYDEQIVQPVSMPVAAAAPKIAAIEPANRQIRTGAKLLSKPDANAILATVNESIAVTAYPLGNGFTGVCWQHEKLQPCAYVADADLADNPAADDKTGANDAKTPNITASFNYEAPRIRFADRSHTDNAQSVSISADIHDNDALKDYEAYIWTHDGLKLKVEKLDYSLLSGTDKSVTIDMPLRSGDNTLVIMVRDKLDTETVDTFHINKP